jgi:zona occludens toxin (predicted ATPase)
MITLFSGIPGSGKSYKMVHDLMIMAPNYYIIHNVEGLKSEVIPNGCNFVEYCQEQNMEVIEFFSKDYQATFCEAVHKKYNKNCLVIIDECHEWFSTNRKDLKMWLSYHRHLNQEIWLVAHKAQNLPALYRSYIEIEYRAKSGSFLAMPGRFFYSRIVGGERVGFTFVKKRADVFAAYSSQKPEGFQKKKPPLFLLGLGAVALAGIALFFYLPQKAMKHSDTVAQKSENEKAPMLNNSTALPVQDTPYSYVGMVGNDHYVEDRKTGQITRFIDLPNPLIYVCSYGSATVKAFDPNKRKHVIITHLPRVIARSAPPTAEVGGKGL